MKFAKAIVKKPCENLIKGLTTANLGIPALGLALKQHQQYIEVLESCGLDVTVLEPDNNFPDSTFVEDTAILTSKCAIITNPGAESRQGEIGEIENVLGRFYENTEYIKKPGTLDGGDVMMVGSHFYIGVSERTNGEGAQQLIKVLGKYGFTGSMVNLQHVLHLKTGVAYLEKNNLLASGEFPEKGAFKHFNILKVEEVESYATNCVWINDFVLVAKGFPKTKQLVEDVGYKTIVLDVSEFRKLDGGLSCLSLRF